MLLANKNSPRGGSSKPALLGTLAALIFAAHCAGAPGTIAVPGFTTGASGPGGFIYDGSRMWVTDASKGLCRMDPAGGGGGGGFTLTNCILPQTSQVSVRAVLGQPAYDPITQFVYVPDMSTASKGIWRYSFVGSTFNALSAANIGTTLAGQRPGAVALGLDGNLYATMAGTSNYVRVNTPNLAAQTVDNMGATLSGKPARGLAFGDTTLWIADVDGEIFVPAATTCATKCKGTLDTQIAVPNPLSIAFDAVNSQMYIGTSFGVFQHNRLTGQTFLYSKHWVSANASGLTTDVTAVGVDNLGNLYYADDPTASQTVGGATVYSVPANSLPDGQGNLGSPAPTIPPSESTAPPFANPAVLYSTGLTTPKGAIYLGTHVWVSDTTLGFCKVNPLPAPSLAPCAVLPLGFVPGSPAYDKATNQVYLADTAGGQGIVKLLFNPATETVGVATAVVSNTVLKNAAANSTAPTALAFGPDKQLYVAMAGSPQILRVANPAGAAPHAVTFIGTMFESTVSIAFNNSDLYDVETSDSSVIYGATLCQGTCTSLFLGVVQILPTAVTADGTYVYFGDAQKVMRFDSVANAFANMADTGLVAGVPTPFAGVTGLATDGQGHVYAADATNMWQIAGSGALATVTALAPFQAPEGSSPTVTITGTNFLATSLVVSTCAAITPGNVTVVSPTQITATFSINPVGPIGACSVTVTTANGASPASAASNFTVLIGPPALTGIIPASGFRGRTVAVSIAGGNMALGGCDPIPGITITNTVINATGTLTTANFVIDPTAALGPRNVTITTPSGPSNILIFTVNAAPPVVTSITPAKGIAATTVPVTLAGTDLFGANLSLPTGFTLSGLPVVTNTSITATLVIAATVPAGPQSITVSTPGGSSNATFTILPALTGIAPSQVRAGASAAVTLTGTSLAGVTSINAGANITVTGVAASAGTVTATFTSAANAPVGPVSVTVTDANGTSNTVSFTLIGPIPVISNISPATGGTGATVAITITGTGLTFGTLNLPAGITLSGTPVATFTTITANIVIAGNATLGAQNIGVTTPGTGNTSNTLPFTVFALAPLINAGGIAPANSVAGTTATVTLTGQGFTGTTRVNTGANITVSSFTVVSASQISATLVIATNALTQSISVTNPNGTSNAVTFSIVPTLTRISPASQPAGTNVLVTVTGNSLTGSATINMGANIQVSSYTIVSNTQVTAVLIIAANAVQGPRNISITTPGGTSNLLSFNVLPPPPAITALNAPFKLGSNQGVTLTGTNLTGANDITAIHVFRNGFAVPIVVSANPVAGSIIVTAGSFQPGATQLKWNWTMPTSLTVSGVYTMTVTTPSGTSPAFGFTVQ